MASSRIGIIGSGDVGQALANGFLKHGHEVMLGYRHREKAVEWQKQAVEKARIGTFSEAAAFGEIVALAVKGSTAGEALVAAGARNLEKKTVIDVTNPIADAAPEGGVLKFFTSLDKSLMESLQAEFPSVNFVKAFNSIGSALMVNPDFGCEKPSMFICGNDEKAKKEVAEIAGHFGFESVDMGTAEAARAIEPLCMLWCIPGLLHNEWAHAFKLLKK